MTKPDNTALEIGILVDEKGRYAGMMPHMAFSGSKGSAAPSSDELPPVPAASTRNSKKARMRHAPWGSDDRLPSTILDRIDEVSMAYNAVKYNAETLLNQGVMYVKKSDLVNGRSNLIRAYDPEIEKFLSRNAVETDLLPGKAWDLASLFNGFSEAIFNINRTKILQLAHKEAEFCRISNFKEDKGLRDRQFLYYSADFATNSIKNDSDYDNANKVVTLPLYDVYDWNFFQNLIKSKAPKFGIHARPRVSRSFYYAAMPWGGLYQKDGWIDAAKNVPRVVTAMQNNQMRTMHMVYIAVDYFEGVYGKSNWIAMDQAERDKIFLETRKNIQDKLVGTDNVLSSLTVMCEMDYHSNAMRKTVVIEAVDDKTKQGHWVPDADHANQQISIGHGVPISQFGLSNSNLKMNSTSGSDNRQGFNTVVTLNTWLQKCLLFDLQLVADFNAANGNSNWDVQFFIDDITHTTTNNQESGIVPAYAQ